MPEALGQCRACAALFEEPGLALPQFPLLGDDSVSALLLRNAPWPMTSPSPSKASRSLWLFALLKEQLRLCKSPN